MGTVTALRRTNGNLGYMNGGTGNVGAYNGLGKLKFNER